MQLAQRREDVSVAPPEGGEQRALLLQPQVLADHFHGHNLAIGQGGLRPALAQAVAVRDPWHSLVNDAKHGDNTAIMKSSRSMAASSGLWQRFLRVSSVLDLVVFNSQRVLGNAQLCR